MAAAEYKLVVEQGATFSQTFYWKDANGSAISLLHYTAEFAVSIGSKSILDLTSATPSSVTIEPSGVTGRIDVSMTPSQVNQLFVGSLLHYSLFITSPSLVTTKLLKGRIVLDRK